MADVIGALFTIAIIAVAIALMMQRIALKDAIALVLVLAVISAVTIAAVHALLVSLAQLASSVWELLRTTAGLLVEVLLFAAILVGAGMAAASVLSRILKPEK